MRTILLMVLSLVYCCLKGQAVKEKKKHNYAITGSFALLSGAADGLNQALVYRYNGFKRVFPKANDQWWNPKISWVNKYKNNDPAQGEKFLGSTTIFVASTDGYHATRFVNRLFAAGAIGFTIGEKKKWHQYLKDAAIYWALNRIGFTLTYNAF